MFSPTRVHLPQRKGALCVCPLFPSEMTRSPLPGICPCQYCLGAPCRTDPTQIFFSFPFSLAAVVVSGLGTYPLVVAFVHTWFWNASLCILVLILKPQSLGFPWACGLVPGIELMAFHWKRQASPSPDTSLSDSVIRLS